MNEIWINTNNTSKTLRTVVAFSNTGKIKLRTGEIKVASLRQKFMFNGKFDRIYKHLAKCFIQRTEDDILNNRTFIDHISHNPSNMNVNDVRNLRWCNQKENLNFNEAASNRRRPLLGKHWKLVDGKRTYY